MASSKLTGLSALAAPSIDDLLYVVDSPGGTPAEKKATIAAVLDARLIDRSRPNITVTSTASETDVYSTTVAGGTLGTTGCIHMLLLGQKLKNGGGGDSAMQMKVYFGTTVLATIHPVNVSVDSPTTFPLILEVDLFADGATNAQIAWCRQYSDNNQGIITTQIVKGTAAEDSTASKTFKVTWTQGNTNLHAYTSKFGYTIVR